MHNHPLPHLFGGRHQLVGFILLGLFLLLGTQPASAEQQSSPASSAGSIPARPIDDHAFQTLLDKAQTTGSVRVIIGLRMNYQPEGNLRLAQAVDLQRNVIGIGQNALVAKMEAHDVRGVKKLKNLPFVAMRVDANALNALSALQEVETITEDALHKPTLAESTALIGATNAWASGYSGQGQTIAILDTGVDKTHPFLAGKVVAEGCFSTTDATDSATSLCPGGVQSSTAVGSGVPCSSGCDHGTHVAGIAAGKGASFSGVARDANIIAVQIFTRFEASACGGTSACVMAYTSDIIQGLQYVQTLAGSFNIASVNMSLGGGGYTSYCDSSNLSTKAAIDNLRSVKIATVIASGNNGYSNQISSPACISSAISVGSTRDGSSGTVADTISSFSNSASFLNLLAPGQYIYSSIPGGGYANYQGTSMATPHVAGAWAVLKSKAPSATVDQVLSALTSTGVSITDSRNGIAKPRIRVDAALNQFAGQSPTVTPTLSNGTLYENTNSAIAYSANWNLWNVSGASGGSTYYSNRTGSTATLTFSGTGMSLFYSKYAGIGVMQIEIDGAVVATLNQSQGATAFQNRWNSAALSAGTHTLKLTHISGTYADLDAISVTPSGGSAPTNTPTNTPTRTPTQLLPTSTPTQTPTSLATNTPTPTPTNGGGGNGAVTYEDTNANITYAGSWYLWNVSGTSGGSTHYSNRAGGTAMLTFDGTGVSLIYSKYAGIGVMQIEIDGAVVATLNQAQGATAFQNRWNSATLSAGTHTLKLTHISGTYADLDAISVTPSGGSAPTNTPTNTPTRTPTQLLPTSTPTRTPTPLATNTPTPTPTNGGGGNGAVTYEDTNANITYAGSWYLWNVSGASGGSTHYSNRPGGTAMLTFNGTGVSLIYSKYGGIGVMQIEIDGAVVATLNQSQGATAFQNSWNSAALSAGTHTLKLTQTSGTYMDLDAIIVR